MLLFRVCLLLRYHRRSRAFDTHAWNGTFLRPRKRQLDRNLCIVKKKERKKKNRDKERKNYLLFIICFSILPSRFRCWRDSLPFVAFRRNSFHRSPCIERHRFTYTWARKKKTCSLSLLSGARYIEIRVPGLYRLPSCTVERLLGLSSARQIAACR